MASTPISNNTNASEVLASLQRTAQATSSQSDAQSKFLTLLTTQLKNQDPLNPLDNAQVTSQLAQISTVDGIERLNATMSKLLEGMNGNDTLQAAALVGHVRRVVVDERSVVIDQSRKVRLFRDNAAIAARMMSTACYWPGCWVPVTDCQIDHLLPAADHGGPTDQENAGPCCGWHNRFRTRGYRTERLADGTLAVLRPDGTRIH